MEVTVVPEEVTDARGVVPADLGAVVAGIAPNRAVLQAEQLHQVVRPLLEPVRHPVQGPQQPVGRQAGSANARLAASIAARASLGPPIAHEPITSPVAGLTESRCSSESAHFPF